MVALSEANTYLVYMSKIIQAEQRESKTKTNFLTFEDINDQKYQYLSSEGGNDHCFSFSSVIQKEMIPRHGNYKNQTLNNIFIIDKSLIG